MHTVDILMKLGLPREVASIIDYIRRREEFRDRVMAFEEISKFAIGVRVLPYKYMVIRIPSHIQAPIKVCFARFVDNNNKGFHHDWIGGSEWTEQYLREYRDVYCRHIDETRAAS